MIFLLAFLGLLQLWTVKEMMHLMVHMHNLEDWAYEQTKEIHFVADKEEI